MPLDRGYYSKPVKHGAKAPMSVKRSTAKARAGKQAAAERKAMKGGPGPEGYTRIK